MADHITATYRLQINKDFTLRDAGQIMPYLKCLGITHIYLSPIFESTKGSMHGYDICDFTKISEERGGEEAFAALDALCRKENMRLLLDIVPNHMGIAGDNPFWIDVLAKGKASRYWSLFDLRVDKDGTIHLPILSKPLEETLSSGEAVIKEHNMYGRVIIMGDRILPLNRESDEHYKPVLWTEAFDKISYRRFFDITDLVGVRVEDCDIYDLSHRCLFELCRKYRSIAGVRVDHIDGLADPATYLSTLKHDIENIWVEKILSGDEKLPGSWPVQGTTGYEFIARLNDLLVDPAGFKVLQAYWRDHIEDTWDDFESCVLQSKNDILDTLFPSELKRLVTLSADAGTEKSAELFWRGMTVALDVYRTYAGENPLSAADKERVRGAAEKATKRLGQGFEQAQKIFLPILLDPKTDKHKQIVREWQQLSGPAMAKGLEDCAHYRYMPLAALNEVGCEASVDTQGAERYFTWTAGIARSYPECFLATSTHDTKRSEDARARLYVLADRPRAWIAFYEQAVALNQSLKKNFLLRPATEYFLYQAIVAVWPQGQIDEEFINRIADYMRKSVKEARVDTSWLKPDAAYENALEKFIRAVLRNGVFIKLAQDFVESVAAAGAINAITALTLKILGPAVPDIYQGADGWVFNLVDPDNRRQVDFPAMPPSKNIPQDWQGRDFKIWHTQKLLQIRRDHWKPELKLKPLSISGAQAEQGIAYEWGDLIVVCPRYPGRQALSRPSPSIDATLELKADTYKNLMTGEIYQQDGALPLNSLFSQSPVAVLALQS